MPGPTIITSPSTSTTFNEHHDNFHHIEFEAPLSADLDLEQRLAHTQGLAQQGEKGRFSIDLSLELERQLNMESPPVTPGYDALTHPDSNEKPNRSSSPRPTHAKKKSEFSPDPDILAHIVTQLRNSVTEITKERDGLLKMLEAANTEQANTKDALQMMTEKATDAEEELTASRKKIREDEEQIVLLRAKVEESRRGLMRLQTESRRQSLAPVDVSRTLSSTFTAFGSPPSSKRASFAPMTGRPGHRRISSVSDSTFGSFPTPDLTPSPNAPGFGNIASPEAAALFSGAPSSSKRYSGMFGRTSPPNPDLLQAGDSVPSGSSSPSSVVAVATSVELESVRKELKVVRDELDTAKHELMEANEAKEASETCVKALREFIADNNIGAMPAGGSSASTAMKLPPPPTMTTGEEEGDPKKTATGWGFKLWGGVDSPLRSSTVGTPLPPSSASSGLATTPGLPPPGQSANGTPVISSAPLSRKLGGFFSSRSSISSVSSQQMPPLQTNAAAMQLPPPQLHLHQSQRDSLYSFSDTSSVAEPISPSSDVHGLGNAGYHLAGNGTGVVKDNGQGYNGTGIVVRDVTNLSHGQREDVDEHGGPPVSVSAGDLEGLR
ncbi:hypothetical protein B0H34DRAFT_796983 [Crassisporium funariophilum]|nr:hypothetical protein B0H34DRAFT_796983 [Crassisporium funariophilum]